jgi:hypothetical protein
MLDKDTADQLERRIDDIVGRMAVSKEDRERMTGMLRYMNLGPGREQQWNAEQYARQSGDALADVRRCYRLLQSSGWITADRARDLLAPAAAELDSIREALKTATGWERHRLLVSALNLCGGRPLPHWLYTALCATLLAPAPEPSIHFVRWNLLLALRDVTGMTWKEALIVAVEKLKGTPAEGNRNAIWESYKAEERKRPPEQKRPRTYRRMKRTRKIPAPKSSL